MSEITSLTQLIGRFVSDMREDEEEKTRPDQVSDVVLVDLDDESPMRQEMIVEAVFDNSIQLRNKQKKSNYYDPDVIVDNLGPASRVKLRMFGFEVPPEPPTPDYSTGTYVLNANEGLFLVEVDRVDDQYYVHLVDSSHAEALTPKVWDRLARFTDPDGDGEYCLEPGCYYVGVVERFVEVIPYNGRCYYRYTDEAELYVLDKDALPDMARVETDTLEVNAAILVPTPNLEQCEEEPQECCGEPETCNT